jgi:hypothetical protein
MSSADKIDLFKLHKDQYAASKKPQLIEAGRAKYLTIDGRGAPGSQIFSAKVGALYSVAYTIKMTRKFAGGRDYTICKLEAQYWFDNESRSFADTPPEQWNWKMMIRTPDFVEDDELTSAVEKLLNKGKEPEVRNISFELLAEGQCVQMLHVGPYDQEHQTVSQMEAFAREQGLEFHGRHHEIYISDPRRVSPERLKTILRQPVKKAAH